MTALIQTQPIDFAQLAAVAGDAIVVCDAEGLITFWNAAAQAMFGFTAEEAMGRSLDIIIPERQRKRHWDGYAVTMRTGETRYGHDLLKVPALHKDGHSLSIAFTVALLKQADGAVTGIAAIIRDETRRWNEERALRRRLAELEAPPA